MQKGILVSMGILLLTLAVACSSASPPASDQPPPDPGNGESQREAASPDVKSSGGPAATSAPESAEGPAANDPAGGPPEGQDAPDGDAAAALAQAEAEFPGQENEQRAPAGAEPDAALPAHGGEPMVDVQPGQEYQSGTRVNFPALGISFDIPQQWIGGLPQGSSAFLMGSNSQPGLVVVLSHQAKSNDELVSYLNQPLPLDENMVLRVSGQPQVDGEWVNADVSTSDGSGTYQGYLKALVRREGTGIVIVAIGPQEQAGYYRQLAGEIATSVRETATTSAAGQGAGDQQPSAANSALAQEWDQFLRGKRLTYLHSYSSGSAGGYSTHYELDLCSDGSFFYYDRSHVSVDTGGAFGYSGGTTTNTGQWRITSQGGQIVAEIRWQDGQTDYSLLEYVDNKTYVDGQRWFVTSDNSSCP
jgi:hypothetical protein